MESAAVQSAGLGRLGHRLTSTVGQKFLMALSGLVLVLFVLGHLVGNLQVYSGPEKLNKYAEFLQGLGAGLWVVRSVIFASLVAHVWSAWRLTLRAWAARPVKYVNEATAKASISSRTMRWTGVAMLLFLGYHLLHFTLGGIPIEGVDPTAPKDVYAMVVHGFRDPANGGSYIVLMLLLGTHLHHGVASVFQTTGIVNDQYRPLLTRAGQVLAWVVMLGNVSMPLAILLNLGPFKDVL
jgi:succinate dehydrogenase / fumarate reductase cytochrome b subunit